MSLTQPPSLKESGLRHNELVPGNFHVASYIPTNHLASEATLHLLSQTQIQ